jgi:hypothetical protein
LSRKRKDLVPSSQSGTRVTSNRAMYQRMSPYFERNEVGKQMSLKELQKLDQASRKQPMLNSLIEQSILVRANY